MMLIILVLPCKDITDLICNHIVRIYEAENQETTRLLANSWNGLDSQPIRGIYSTFFLHENVECSFL